MHDDVIYNGRYIWNELKAEINYNKHGVKFENASEVFDDPILLKNMMKTLEDTLVKDEIVTESGRVFRPGNKNLLENIPSDIVKEMAKRKWENIKRHNEKKA
jgi:hypothetical protein